MSARRALVAVLCCAAGACAAADATPPGVVRTFALNNAGFEAPLLADGSIAGWEATVHATPSAYAIDIDPHVAHGGKASARVHKTGSEPWGMVHQTLPAMPLAAGTLQFSAWVKTDGASGTGAILVLRTLANSTTDRYVFMDPPVTGSQEWRRYTVRLAVPAGTQVVDAGAMLQGEGTLWVDDAELVMLR